MERVSQPTRHRLPTKTFLWVPDPDTWRRDAHLAREGGLEGCGGGGLESAQGKRTRRSSPGPGSAARSERNAAYSAPGGGGARGGREVEPLPFKGAAVPLRRVFSLAEEGVGQEASNCAKGTRWEASPPSREAAPEAVPASGLLPPPRSLGRDSGHIPRVGGALPSPSPGCTSPRTPRCPGLERSGVP